MDMKFDWYKIRMASLKLPPEQAKMAIGAAILEAVNTAIVMFQDSLELDVTKFILDKMESAVDNDNDSPRAAKSEDAIDNAFLRATKTWKPDGKSFEQMLAEKQQMHNDPDAFAQAMAAEKVTPGIIQKARRGRKPKNPDQPPKKRGRKPKAVQA